MGIFWLVLFETAWYNSRIIGTTIGAHRHKTDEPLIFRKSLAF